MNICGSVVAAFSKKHGLFPHRLLIIHDELDFPCGKARFKKGGGEGGHNGLRSISAHLKSGDYWRLRIGVGKPPTKEEGRSHVLQSPSLAEWEKLTSLVVPVTNALTDLINGYEGKAMNELHRI